MKLDDYIASSIMAYPTLYCKNTYRKSRRAVLNQLFLVIGNGVEFVPRKNGKGFFSDGKKQKLKKSDVGRVQNSEQIAIVYDKIDEKMAKFGMFFGRMDAREKILFYRDFLDSGEKHLLFGEDTNGPLNVEGYDKFVEIYPKDDKEYRWHPYPFSLKYSSLHDDRTNELIDPSLIAEDWRKGIVEIFHIANEWFQDDESFKADRYFNWAEYWRDDDSNYFLTAWNKQPDKLKFCAEYEIEPKLYTDPKEMAKAIVAHRRKQIIDEANKAIRFYEQ